MCSKAFPLGILAQVFCTFIRSSKDNQGEGWKCDQRWQPCRERYCCSDHQKHSLPKRFTANLSSHGYEWINKLLLLFLKDIFKKIIRAPKTIKLWWSIYIPHLLGFSSIQSFICASLLFAISCEDIYSAKQNIIRGIYKGWFCREEQCSNSMHHHSTDPVIILFTCPYFSTESTRLCSANTGTSVTTFIIPKCGTKGWFCGTVYNFGGQDSPSLPPAHTQKNSLCTEGNHSLPILLVLTQNEVMQKRDTKWGLAEMWYQMRSCRNEIPDVWLFYRNFRIHGQGNISVWSQWTSNS